MITVKELQNKRLQSVDAYSGVYDLFGIEFNYTDSTSDIVGSLDETKREAILQNDEQLVGVKVGLIEGTIPLDREKLIV